MTVKLTARPEPISLERSGQRITAHAGLVLVRELGERLGLPDLLDELTLKERERGYSPSEGVMALVETLVAGGECLDDAALLGADPAQEVLRGGPLPDPTTLGRLLRRFALGHIGQLNRALDRLFARARPLIGAGEVVTLDLDATYIETHSPEGSRQGARGTYKGRVCWHPLLCFRAETGEWVHAKLRNGRAGASTGAVRFLDQALRRVPEGAEVRLRADEGFYGQPTLSALEERGITYAIGAMLNARLKARIAEIPEADWGPCDYRKGSQVASFHFKPPSWPVARRFVVRRDPARRGEQLDLAEGEWHHWALVTNDTRRSARELEAWQRQKANVENGIREAKLGFGLDNLPSQRFHANWAYLLVTLLAFNLVVWLKAAALPASERRSYAKRIRFRFIAVGATVGRSGRRLVLRLQAGYALFREFAAALARVRALPAPT